MFLLNFPDLICLYAKMSNGWHVWKCHRIPSLLQILNAILHCHMSEHTIINVSIYNFPNLNVELLQIFKVYPHQHILMNYYS